METIKKGSKGEVVGTWQEFLKNLDLYVYNIDNDFGNLTHNATLKFQSLNGLIEDGIVGKNTWAKAYSLGIITTDEMEEPIVSEDFDIKVEQAFMPRDEYYYSSEKKDWVFIHHTAGWNNPFNTIKNWSNDTRGRVATEFVLGGQKITDGDRKYDGAIAQAFADGGYGWHLGIGNNIMHRASVGIEVCNFGFLYLGGYYKKVNGVRTWIKGKPNKFYTYVGTEAEDSQAIELKKEFRGHKYWHRYSDLQLSQLKKLIVFIGERNEIDVRKGLPQMIREKGADAFDVCDVEMCKKTKGLWSHTNCRSTKVDMFPQEELMDMLLSL